MGSLTRPRSAAFAHASSRASEVSLPPPQEHPQTKGMTSPTRVRADPKPPLGPAREAPPPAATRRPGDTDPRPAPSPRDAQAPARATSAGAPQEEHPEKNPGPPPGGPRPGDAEPPPTSPRPGPPSPAHPARPAASSSRRRPASPPQAAAGAAARAGLRSRAGARTAPSVDRRHPPRRLLPAPSSPLPGQLAASAAPGARRLSAPSQAGALSRTWLIWARPPPPPPTRPRAQPRAVRHRLLGAPAAAAAAAAAAWAGGVCSRSSRGGKALARGRGLPAFAQVWGREVEPV